MLHLQQISSKISSVDCKATPLAVFIKLIL
jgi:hypothetical protein